MSEFILTEKIDKVFRIEINRPERRNAISSDEYGGIAKAINEGEQDPSIRVIVIHGQKDFFSACPPNGAGKLQAGREAVRLSFSPADYARNVYNR